VAACLGDLVTLSLLGVVSAFNVYFVHTPIPFIIIIALTLAAAGWSIITRRNSYVGHLLFQGWSPLFAAMIISCGTGIVLDLFVSRYEGFAVLAIVISGRYYLFYSEILSHMVSLGLPGNVGAILVSRLSTALHAAEISQSALPSSSTDHVNGHGSTAQPTTRLVMCCLLAVTIPIEIAFLITLRAIGWLHVPAIFLIYSLAFFCLTVCLFLDLSLEI
jgi:solute carrier family 41